MLSRTDAAENLNGLDLDGGWRVVGKIDRDPNSTGGNFCVGYWVENVDGRKGFCKALNLARAFTSPNPAVLLEQLTTAYNFECELLKKCEDRNMSRVVLALAQGTVNVPGFQFSNVNYIIFERADGDIRSVLNTAKVFDIAAMLRCLHHVATGLKQLHTNSIAHQDIKPSNVLVFSGQYDSGALSKVSDLGRATDRSKSAEHDDYPIAGDPAYAPPEQLYGAIPLEFGPRRLACDLYQLGSLTAFLLTGVSFNGALLQELYPTHAWHVWGGTYEEVLPYVRDAYGRTISRLSENFPDFLRGDLVRILRYLCEPDPKRRGHPVQLRRNFRYPYDVSRIVTEFDRLTRRAEVHLGIMR